MLLVNAGVIHRVGPHRLHVRLARRLAEAGYLALRMDLSGIGDSDAVPDQLTFRVSSVADIRAAIDALAVNNPAVGVIVFGVCSGADNALAAAQADPRIVGLVLIDSHSYATRRSRLRALRVQLRRPGAWAALPARVFSRLRTTPAADAAASSAETSGRQPPAVQDYRRQLVGLVSRNVRILSIYSSAQGARHNHPDQLFELFPELRGKLDSHYYPKANHTFTELSQQTALMSVVMQWCQHVFPASVSALKR